MIILRKLSQIHPDIPLVWKLFSESFHEHERIIFSDLLDCPALQAHTIHVAYQAHLEKVTGSIEVGKSAELVVLDSNIETTPADQIQDIKVLETVFKGKTVFKNT